MRPRLRSKTSIAPSGRVTLVAPVADENFGLAVDSRGRVLVAEAAARRVIRIEDGRKTPLASSARPWFPTGVAARGDTIFVLEATDYVRGTPVRMRVRRIAASGESRTLATVSIPPA